MQHHPEDVPDEMSVCARCEKRRATPHPSKKGDVCDHCKDVLDRAERRNKVRREARKRAEKKAALKIVKKRARKEKAKQVRKARRATDFDGNGVCPKVGMKRPSRNRGEGAPFVATLPTATYLSLTIVMNQASSEDFCATGVTGGWDFFRTTPTACGGRLNTLRPSTLFRVS